MKEEEEDGVRDRATKPENEQGLAKIRTRSHLYNSIISITAGRPAHRSGAASYINFWRPVLKSPPCSSSFYLAYKKVSIPPPDSCGRT